MTVTRYESNIHPMDNGGMVEDQSGAFVKYEDYLKVVAERDTLQSKTLRPTAEEVAEQISRFVNSISQSQVKELGIAMCKDHRTLIQSKMRFVMAFLGELSDLYAHKFYDARNEQACKVADKMLSALDDMDKCLPFI